MTNILPTTVAATFGAEGSCTRFSAEIGRQSNGCAFSHLKYLGFQKYKQKRVNQARLKSHRTSYTSGMHGGDERSDNSRNCMKADKS